jgi:peptidoglycan/xylan/chitin deacetylase (PgdA/CDA1 family)
MTAIASAAPAASPRPGVVRIASFGYHDVTDDPADSGFQGRSALEYKHTRWVFSRHLEQFARGPVRPRLATDIDLTVPRRHVCITFDDGGKGALHAGEELSRRGWRGHFFITSDRIGSPTFLSAPEIRYLAECGHDIGSHSHTHPHIFRDQPFARMVEEWRVSCDRLSEILGRRVRTASVPGGHISNAVLESASVAGLEFLFTSGASLHPRRVGGCWVIGRYLPTTATSAGEVGALASFRGWTRVFLRRRLKDLASQTLPPLYRLYVRRKTRD